ncbi:MAG: SAM-dependent methyltransferase [Candidatus Binatia bacterium]
MKPLAGIFIAVLAVLIVSAAPSSGQGLRGSSVGMRGFAGPAQTRSATIPSRVPAQGLSIAPSPFVSRAGPGISFHRSQARFSGNFRRGSIVVFPGPVFGGLAPVRFAPFHQFPYYDRSFHRHPGVLIIEVPSFIETSVTSNYAPAVVPTDRRYAEGSSGTTYDRGASQVAPFDPTPREVLERMLTLAKVKSGDVLYDLGSGDGRIVIAAAKKFGIRAVGFEIDPGLIKLARENARQQGVEKLVEFREQDFLTANLSQASLVTLYLSYDGNLAVRPLLMQQLKPGARVVSYTFDMGDWSPKIVESYRDRGGDTHMIYLWEIGEPLAFSDGPH